jgi:membrane protein implicated in regulation of membrane protease activity
MRRAADAIYEDVSEARQELYFGGGYKSWFSYKLPKALQIIGVLASLAIMGFEALLVVSMYDAYKWRKEVKRRRKEEYRRQQYYINQAKYYNMSVQHPRATTRR